jgi:hypothetical protein
VTVNACEMHGQVRSGTRDLRLVSRLVFERVAKAGAFDLLATGDPAPEPLATGDVKPRARGHRAGGRHSPQHAWGAAPSRFSARPPPGIAAAVVYRSRSSCRRHLVGAHKGGPFGAYRDQAFADTRCRGRADRGGGARSIPLKPSCTLIWSLVRHGPKMQRTSNHVSRKAESTVAPISANPGSARGGSRPRSAEG